MKMAVDHCFLIPPCINLEMATNGSEHGNNDPGGRRPRPLGEQAGSAAGIGFVDDGALPLRAVAVLRSDRLDELKRQVEEGTYLVDSRAVAEKMLIALSRRRRG